MPKVSAANRCYLQLVFHSTAHMQAALPNPLCLSTDLLRRLCHSHVDKRRAECLFCLQFKTSEIASRCAGLIRVNIYKDSIVNADRLPPLPGVAALSSMLEPHYEALRSSSGQAAHSKPTYNVTDAERRASLDFLTVRPNLPAYNNAILQETGCPVHLH